MSDMKRDKVMTGAAGVYYVCAELSRRGHIALPTLRQTKGVDVLASSANGHRQVELQVKTSAVKYHHHWRLSDKAEELARPSLFYAFVVLPDDGPPRFYIVPSAVVAEYTRTEHADWSARAGKYGQAHNPTPMRIFRDKEGTYHDRWDLLGLEEGE